jgi:hypothetical protein
MNVKFVNFFKSTIANVGGIGSGDLEFDLSAGDGAKCPTIAAGEYFYLTLVDTSGNREIVKVTDVTSDTCTIERAQDGTTARAFAQSDYVGLRLTQGTMEDIEAAIESIIESNTVMLFGQASAPTGWTKKTDWTDNSMLIYTSGAPAAGGSDSPKSWATAIAIVAAADHTHTGPSHTHTGPSHTHTGPSHQHGLPLGTDLVNGIWIANQFSGTRSMNYGGFSGFGAGVLTKPQLISDAGGTGATGAASGTTGAGGTGATGSGGGHTHTVTQDTFAPKYQNVIAAVRN